MEQHPPLDRFERANQIFSEALELPPESRDRYVQTHCSSDERLAQSVLAMLRRLESMGSFLEEPVRKASRAELQPGQLLSARFRIVEMLGRGGMGEVYRADDLTLGESVAVKIIRARWRDEPSMLARFHDEIRLARRIGHPAVCRIFDLFTTTLDGESIAFFTMEYLPGETLASRIARQGPLNAAEVLRIAGEIAAGIDAAHLTGVVHRDLKPSNVIHVPVPGSPERIVITDFGLARLYEREAEDTSHTMVGHLVGSPDYMAPEQFQGAPSTPATDVFALGLIIFEMAAARRPWPAPDIIRATALRLTMPPPALSSLANVPRHWDRVLSSALAIRPDQRPRTARALIDALDNGRISPRVHRPNRRAIIAGGSLFVTVAAFYEWLRISGRSAPNAPVIMLTPIAESPDRLRGEALDLFLAAQLAQSPRLRLLDTGRIRNAWKRMNGGTTPLPAKLEPRTAREIALREGASLVLFSAWERSFTGKPVVRFTAQLTGTDPASVAREWNRSFGPDLTASELAQKASAWLREEVIRESADELSIERRRPEDITTSSWPALQSYLEANDAWNAEYGRGSAHNPAVAESPARAARALFETALQQDPAFALAEARLGDILLASGEMDEGFRHYQNALKLGTARLSDRESFRMRGIIALDSGQNQKAAEIFYNFSLRFPYDPLPVFHRATAAARLGRGDEALQLYRKALESDPQYFPFVNTLTVECLNQNRVGEARTLCENGSKIRNNDWTDQTRCGIAFAALDRDGVERSLVALRKNGSVPFQSRSYLMEGCWQAENGQARDAERTLNEGLQFDARNGLSDEIRREKLRLLAQLAVAKERKADAIRISKDGLRQEIGYEARMAFACLLVQAGDARAAAEYLPAAPQEWPVYAYWDNRLRGEIALAKQDARAALRFMRAAEDPARQIWSEHTVRAALAAGDPATAIAKCAELLKEPGRYWLQPHLTGPGFFRYACTVLDAHRDRVDPGVAKQVDRTLIFLKYPKNLT